jgi:hypothetical protein
MVAGAGSANPAYILNDGEYLSSAPTDPTYYSPGRNITYDTAELTRNLQRIYTADSRETTNSIPENVRGTLSASWILSGNQFHELIFNDNTDGDSLPDAFDTDRQPEAWWHLPVEYIDGAGTSVEQRVIKGWACQSWELTWNNGSPVRTTVSGPYGDEARSTTEDVDTVTRASNPMPSHSAELQIDGTIQTKLNSIRLRAEPVSRLQDAVGPHPADAVGAQPTPTLEVDGIFTSEQSTNIQHAYGGTSATEVQDNLDPLPATLEFTDGTGSTVAKYDMSGLKPESIAWDDLVNPENDLSQSTLFQINGLSADA